MFSQSPHLGKYGHTPLSLRQRHLYDTILCEITKIMQSVLVSPVSIYLSSTSVSKSDYQSFASTVLRAASSYFAKINFRKVCWSVVFVCLIVCLIVCLCAV